MYINYDSSVQWALLNVVKEALTMMASGAPMGEHHFYITFRTNADGVVLPGYLKEKYQTEITIVLQYQFNDLVVQNTFFTVALNFTGQTEQISVPYHTITQFADPSVDFVLQFNPELLAHHMNKAGEGDETNEVYDENIIKFNDLIK